MQGGNLLIIEDDAASARELSRIGSEAGTVHLAGTLLEAGAWLSKGFDWAAFVVDLRLPDGSGLDFLARARQAYPETPAVLCTGFMEDDTVELAYALGARCVDKGGYGLDQVRYFLRGVLEARSGEPDPVLTAARARCARFYYTEAETDVFVQRAQGLTREEIARGRGTTPRTVRGQEQSICQKSGDLDMDDAIARFFREAMREGWRR